MTGKVKGELIKMSGGTSTLVDNKIINIGNK